MPAIVNIVNVSQEVVVIPDMFGLSLNIGETENALQFGEEILLKSADLAVQIGLGNVDVTDGIITYKKADALNYIRGINQTTKDGKNIFTASDRPKDHYRHITGRADNFVTNKIGNGDPIALSVEPGNTEYFDIKFLDNVYVKDGSMWYKDAEFGSNLSVVVVCPANYPFPAPAGNGNYDIVNGIPTQNANNTGQYFIVPVETVVFRFVNAMNFFGEGKEIVTSVEPFLLNAPYFLRISITAGPTPQNGTIKTLQANLNVGTYRKNTIN